MPAWQLRRCPTCQQYTMGALCSKDQTPTQTAHPPKYSLLDKWAAYRRKEKYSQPATAPKNTLA